MEVESHNRIPELYGDETNVNRWVRIKREALVLGIKKSLTARPNGRSADFIAPSTANGCAMACAPTTTLPNAKASFATKHVNRDLLDWDPCGRTRIRFSLMPQRDAKILDIRTSPIEERIAAIDDFVAADTKCT